jgi:SAM-dependent methyltransferase
VADLDYHAPNLIDWEAAWAPHDEATYRAALRFIEPDDVVLDIGAGDLRFARRVARIAHRVIAIERRAELLPFPFGQSHTTPPLPSNLTVLCGDALAIPFPRGATLAVLLMRHCRHFAQYVARLRAAGCQRLITNARWGMDVELVSLARKPPYAAAPAGWYACLCGSVGFAECASDSLTPAALTRISQVENCPACSGS